MRLIFMQDIMSLFKHLLPLVPIVLLITLFFYRFSYKKGNKFNNEEMKKISEDSCILRFFGFNREDYFYDELYFYQCRENNTKKIPLSCIIRVKPELIKIINRRVWSVRYIIDGTEKEMRFVHNFTLFNRNFAGFLFAVKSANPNAEVKDATLFTL